jgi:peptidoglycan/xylan/chitin deacetylase (PgdA/CDA1 family)
MRSFKADLLAAAFIAVAAAPFAVVSARAGHDGPRASAAPVPRQATVRLAVQNSAPLQAESTPVPVQADAPAHPQDTTPAAAAKPDAAAAPAPDSKQDVKPDASKDTKPDSTGPAHAQSPAPVPAAAQNCPGNPNALGTSRVLAIDPADYKRVGRMSYPDTLPLQDKEVVITFDDGPLPPHTSQILDILASECVKATFFVVGEMARAYPAVVRREYEEGHTIGTHSDHHPLHFGELPIERMRAEIDGGISDVGAALGDTKYLAPFFRIPGLDRSETLENELAARHLIVFSVDAVADDWHHGITPDQIKSLALSRLMKLGKGILLLHDIHPKTVAALPGILKGLKDNGFRIVQVVPSASYQIAMANKPKTPVLASAAPDEIKIGGGIDNAGAQPAWPQPAALASKNLKPDDIALPAPDASSFQPDSGMPDDSTSVQWPEQPKATASSDEDAHGDKASEHEHHRKHNADSDAHDRHHRRHERARGSSEGHRADLTSKIKAIASMFTPAH